MVNLWTELIFNGVSIFTLSANSPLLPVLMAEAIYSAHQRVIGLVKITIDRVRIHLLANLFLPFQISNNIKKTFFIYKIEGNTQKVENKVSGRVRVGVEKALFSQ